MLKNQLRPQAEGDILEQYWKLIFNEVRVKSPIQPWREKIRSDLKTIDKNVRKQLRERKSA